MKKNLLLIIITILSIGRVSADTFLEDFTVTRKDLAPYRSPSERQMEYETPDRIFQHLRSRGVGTKHWEFWNRIIGQEERGCFGYHAAKQQFRIFQDIIKIIFEEILEFEIKQDFHFFRIPLDPLLNEHLNSLNFLQTYPYINDSRPEQRDQIVSMNYTLFGNYTNGAQCTSCYFVNNQSWFTIDYGKKLQFLFDQLGLPTSQIPDLFRTGSQFEYQDSGVLYQFFDTSHYNPNNNNAYALVDQIVYPAIAAGPLDKNVTANLSDIFQATHKAKFDTKTGQLRLIVNTPLSSNPYSRISIRRFEMTDPKIVQSYETALRKKIRELSRDPNKVKYYKKQIEDAWHVKND